MNIDPGDLLGLSPIADLSVHLGASLPVGPPDLATLNEISFEGYTPGRFATASQVIQTNGWTFVTGDVSFTCAANTGFSAACVWIVSTASGAPRLAAFQPVFNDEISLPSSGTIFLTLSVSLFEIPPGF